ncbi:MAG: maleylpyruvate isomerase N-terminal domain-containing protein [Saprospiraceae bacterium]|nr:maleylpyruvate isomerase N-terminal domain-containing protein [Candidatus Opimibacter skivensis]
MYTDVPVATIQLFAALDELLIELLESLSPEDWHKQTLAPDWKVKDVAAHLLDGNIRSLSSSRDGYKPDVSGSINSYQELVRYLNLLNRDWVSAMKRVSPQMLVALLSTTNALYREHLAQLDPFQKSIFPVAWAGESESQNWFHIAREYTEKWHHQQQIRHALGGSSPLFSESFFKPYLETSLRALPYQLKSFKADIGDTFSLLVSGEGGGEWHLLYTPEGWVFTAEAPSYAVTKVHIDDQVIWRMFSRQISGEELNNRVMVSGNKALAELFLDMKAVMV